jgi:hypothetical protein
MGNDVWQLQKTTLKRLWWLYISLSPIYKNLQARQELAVKPMFPLERIAYLFNDKSTKRMRDEDDRPVHFVLQ